jgi:xylulokinase
MDSGQWLRAFAVCCGALAARAGSSSAAGRAASLADVKAVVISGNGPSLTPVLGEPKLTPEGLCLKAAPSRLWLDRRAEAAAAEVSALMGGFVDPGFFLPKILAIKKNEEPLYGQTRFFLGCPEFLAYALTGEAKSVFPSEGFDRWFWNDDILGKLNLDSSKFPPFIRPAEIFGSLLPSVAARFGLSPDIPVISGGPDFFAAIIGAGVIKPGQVCDRSGTSEGINVCTVDRVADSRLMCYGHPVKPFWNVSGTISTTGRAVEWGKELLGLESYDEFYALARSARPAPESPLFLPYLAGERAPVWDPRAKGVIRNLSLSTGRAELARAVLEGICFAIRDVLSVMDEAGAEARELRVAGSAANCDILNEIKANISGREVLVPVQKETELLGLAIIGACNRGAYNSLTEAASALVRIESRRQPDEKYAELYSRLFAEYRETYRSLKRNSREL